MALIFEQTHLQFKFEVLNQGVLYDQGVYITSLVWSTLMSKIT